MKIQNKSFAVFDVKILFPAILLLCLNAIWVLSAWPASLSPDSLTVIDYIRQGRYLDWHTITWLLYVKLTTLNGSAIWLSILIQVSLMNFLIFQLIQFFRPELKKEKIFWLCIVLVSTPWIGANQVTLWKDVTYSIFVLLGVLWIIKSIQNGKFSVKGISALTFGSACRHEGWLTLLIALGMIGLITLSNRRKMNKQNRFILVSSLIIAIAFSVVGNSFLINATNSERNPNWTRTQTFLGDIAYVVSVAPETLDPETVEFVKSHTTSPIGLSRQICENAAPFLQSTGFDQNVANYNAPEVLNQWFKVLLKNPKDLARGHFCKSKAFLPWPFTGYTSYSYYWFEWGMWTPNYLNMEPEPPLVILRSLMTFWLEIWNINGKFLSATGWQISLLTVLLIFLRRKNYISSVGLISFMCLAWSRDLLLIALGHGGDARLSILISIVLLTSGAAAISTLSKNKIKMDRHTS